MIERERRRAEIYIVCDISASIMFSMHTRGTQWHTIISSFHPDSIMAWAHTETLQFNLNNNNIENKVTHKAITSNIIETSRIFAVSQSKKWKNEQT